MELIIYLVVVFLGLAAFLALFISGQRQEKQVTTINPLLAGFHAQSLEAAEKAATDPVTAADNTLDQNRADQVVRLEQKILILEQMLEEKNAELGARNKDLLSEQAARAEFDTLKAILQHQIDDLKVQNKVLKEDLGRARQQNIGLQSSKPIAESQGLQFFQEVKETSILSNPVDDYVRAEPDIVPLPLKKVPAFIDDGSLAKDVPLVSPDQSLTLQDIFGQEDKINNKESKGVDA